MNKDITGEMARTLMQATSEILAKQFDSQRQLLNHELSLKLELQKRQVYSEYLSKVETVHSVILNTSIATTNTLNTALNGLIDVIYSVPDIPEESKVQLIGYTNKIFANMAEKMGNEFSAALSKGEFHAEPIKRASEDEG